MDNLLTGKVAIITGAGSGVGAAACLFFARQGAKVVGADVALDGAEATAALVRDMGGEAEAVACDVSDFAAVEQLVARTVETFGRLDIIYNNAGTTIPPLPDGGGMRKLVDTESDQIDHIFAVNVRGVLNGCKAAIAQFERQGGGGAIVNTASVAGLLGYGGVAYGSTKGAVVNLTRALAIEVAAQDIRVNSVCPAGMLTRYAGMNPDGEHADRIREGMGRQHPLGRAIDPEDTAAAAAFLASDLARNITGVNLPVDGGLSAGIPLARR